MASLAFKLHTFQIFPPDNGGRPPKHVGENIMFYTLFMLKLLVFRRIRKTAKSDLITSRPILLRMRNVPDREFVEKI